MGKVKGYLSEIFFSLQGEGYYAGEIHLFIRLSGCDLRCSYCDTPYALNFSKDFTIFKAQKKEIRENPVSPEEVLEILEEHFPLNYEKIMITGGEPLYQENFVEELIKHLKIRPIILETSGSNAEGINKIAPYVKAISLDAKLPISSGIEKGLDMFKKSIRFCGDTFTYFKAVVNPEEDEKVIEEVSQLIARERGKEGFLFIQPSQKINFERLFSFYRAARKHLKNVKILPQIHKILALK